MSMKLSSSVSSSARCWLVIDPAARHDDRPLDGVLQLAHVAGPVVGDQRLHRLLGDPGRRRGRRVAELRQEVLHQQRDVVLALSQRRHMDGDHVQAVVQVLAETPGVDLFLQVPVGRGDHPAVDLDRRAAADPLELLVLEHAQQLALGRQGSCRRSRPGRSCPCGPSRSGPCAGPARR